MQGRYGFPGAYLLVHISVPVPYRRNTVEIRKSKEVAHRDPFFERPTTDANLDNDE
jgi:hypothetical protein